MSFLVLGYVCEGWRLVADRDTVNRVKSVPVGWDMTLCGDPSCYPCHGGPWHWGDSGGLSAKLFSRTWSMLFLPFAHPDLIFLAFKFFCIVTLGKKIKMNLKGYAVSIPRTPNPEVRVSPGWLMSLQPGKNFKGSVCSDTSPADSSVAEGCFKCELTVNNWSTQHEEKT